MKRSRSRRAAEFAGTKRRRCVPSPQREEGQDEGVRTVEFNSESSEPPHPDPLPSGEREFLSASKRRDFHATLTSRPLRKAAASGRVSAYRRLFENPAPASPG